MALIVQIKPRARREINEAAAWWSQNRLAAVGAVFHDLHEALKLLVEFPGVGTRVETTQSPETRRWLLKRISHHVYYRVRGNVLEVVAFWGNGQRAWPAGLATTKRAFCLVLDDVDEATCPQPPAGRGGQALLFASKSQELTPASR